MNRLVGILGVLGFGVSCGSKRPTTGTDASGVDAPATCAANALCLELLAGRLDNSGSVDGTGSGALFSLPTGVAVDDTGNVYVADYLNFTIRKVSSVGVVTTLAGMAGSAGNVDGTGSGARFSYPSGVAVDGGGNVYVADCGNGTIRQVSSSAVVTTLAGAAGLVGSADGSRFDARFNCPNGVATDGSGNIYISDLDNCTVRRLTSSGVVTTIAGSASGCCTVAGDVNCVSVDGTGSAARFVGPSALALDDAGNLYVADDNAIRKITQGGIVTTLAGHNESYSGGSADGMGSAASFEIAEGVTVDAQGNVYVADSFYGLIRKVTPQGLVTTVAGNGRGSTTLGPTPGFSGLWNLAISGSSLVIADSPSNVENANAIVVLENAVP